MFSFAMIATLYSYKLISVNFVILSLCSSLLWFWVKALKEKLSTKIENLELMSLQAQDSTTIAEYKLLRRTGALTLAQSAHPIRGAHLIRDSSMDARTVCNRTDKKDNLGYSRQRMLPKYLRFLACLLARCANCRHQIVL